MSKDPKTCGHKGPHKPKRLASADKTHPDLLLQSYDYPLPSELIALSPPKDRASARLLVYDRATDTITHSSFSHLLDFVPKDATFIFNDTRVLKARLFGRKRSVAATKRIEIFYHRLLEGGRLLVQTRGRLRARDIVDVEMRGVGKETHSKIANTGQDSYLRVESKINSNTAGAWQDFHLKVERKAHLNFHSTSLQNLAFKIEEVRPQGFKVISLLQDDTELPATPRAIEQILEAFGHVPLPPYIKRADRLEDEVTYNSVFAKKLGAVAAPTASLHFSDALYSAVCKDFPHTHITLHIGAGTFSSIDVENIEDHAMHSESFYISDHAREVIDNAKALLCVGTTATRTVEYYARAMPYLGEFKGLNFDSKVERNSANKAALEAMQIIEDTDGSISGQCDLFLHPFNRPLLTRYLITNFHLPKSTLIMLVSAFIGREKTLELYKIAIKEGYAFYSYGDGMLII